jgi:hypothetical protein
MEVAATRRPGRADGRLRARRARPPAGGPRRAGAPICDGRTRAAGTREGAPRRVVGRPRRARGNYAAVEGVVRRCSTRRNWLVARAAMADDASVSAWRAPGARCSVLEEQDGDVLREGVRVLAQALMDSEVTGLVGAERHERSDDRTAYRNGTRVRNWDTRVGTVDAIRLVGRDPAGAGRRMGGRRATLLQHRIDEPPADALV